MLLWSLLRLGSAEGLEEAEVSGVSVESVSWSIRGIKLRSAGGKSSAKEREKDSSDICI